MLQPDKFFDNIFEEERLPSSRLAAFAKDTADKLATETAEPFAGLRSALLPPLQALQNELGEIDTSLLGQKEKTQTADQFIANFKKVMKASQLGIEYAFGGRETKEYKQFFPKGLAEYTQATKKEMPVLTFRLKELALKFGPKLDPVVAGQFGEFESDWNQLTAKQSESRKATKENRSQRTAARKSLETPLLKAIHTIAALYPGDKERCLKFFDFSLLKAARHKSLEKKVPDPATPSV